MGEGKLEMKNKSEERNKERERGRGDKSKWEMDDRGEYRWLNGGERGGRIMKGRWCWGEVGE